MDDVFFFQAEDGIRDLVRSRGLGDVYKRQVPVQAVEPGAPVAVRGRACVDEPQHRVRVAVPEACLLYTSDAADERSSVDLGGRRIIKKRNKEDKRKGRSNRGM